ncbi:MAG TPA: hypothetical protein PLF63_04090, partial [Rubrivivax sp.]|nr:hypothetical protein [Rubrivivax sp.]
MHALPQTSPRPSDPSKRSRQQARARSHWQAGQAQAKRRAWADAARSFEAACRLAPDDDVFALNLARTWLALGRIDDATREAARAYTLAPRNHVACALTAHCLMEARRYRDAARCLRSLPADLPRGYDYHFALGRALQLGNRPREAVAAYMDALAIDITVANLHYQLG